MKVAAFLEQISDEQGPLKIVAADLIERMNDGDFEELCADIRTEQTHGLLAAGGEFHPTNKDHH